jgi:hypothetical protein
MQYDEVETRLDGLRTRLEERKAVGYRDVVELIDVMIGTRLERRVDRREFDTGKAPEPTSSTTEGAVGNEAPQPTANNDHSQDGA